MKRKDKKSVFQISFAIILLAVSVMVFVLYSNNLKNELRELVLDTLKEVSNQNVLVVQKEIEGDQNALTEIAERIGTLRNADEKEIIDTLKGILDRYSFKRMGFSWQDGQAYTTDDRVIDISESNYFLSAIQGENYISALARDPLDDDEIIVFSAPIKSGEDILGVVYAVYRVESLKEILSVSSFEGEGYTYIVQSSGDKVVDSVNPTSFQNMTNIYKSMEEADKRNSQAVRDLKILLGHDRTGYVIFYNKIGKYMYATPLGINDWFLIDVVPVDFMESTSNYIIRRTYTVCVILAVVCVVIAIMIFWGERRKKKQMQNLLYKDELTGGSTLMKFKLDAEARVGEYHDKCALIMLDLDDFKLVNELFGYEEGDRVLRYIFEAIQKDCNDGECLGRGGGDHYYLLLHFETKKEIEERVLKITEDIQHCYIANASEYILHPVFGIYYVDRYDEDVEDMLNCVTLAHNLAKQERDCIYKIYTDILKERIVNKKQLSDQIEHACDNHEFVVYYQPKYESKTQKLVGAEALVRWRKPNGQMISPGLFIPLAEESGFVCKLDVYMFKEVCLAQKRWLDKGLEIVPISVNLSRRHLDNPDFIDEYKQILDESGVPIEYVQLEITESAMYEKQEEFVAIMERLHQLGFVILMDDFGTGYSSLMMLKSIPVDVMKLDKSFVDDFDDARGEQIIRCVMKMAQDLRIGITAEGVETKEQFEFLKSIGCDTIQGYYFARPMPEDEFEARMA
ncbi:MAG: EAL domain-containing protein [Ruminococcus sp.]|nr:EAL domain-containing protein [Ruminococcus sp.]